MPNRTGKNWIALFSSNFLGVFNDNLLKNSIIFFSITWNIPTWLNQSQLISIVSAALILPYLLFSPLAGNITVKISKLKIFRFFKLLEIPIMLLASMAFLFKNIYLAILTVLLMGILSCFYSPSKYSLVKDIGGEKKVAFGSGVLETVAFVGILLGTVLASFLSDNYGVMALIAVFLITALAGYFITKQIKVDELAVEDSKQSNNPFLFVVQMYKVAKRYKEVNLSIFGSSVFWLIGGMLQMNLVIHSTQVFNTTNTETGFVMAIAAIGIAFGLTLAAKIAGQTTGRNLILPGIAGMIIFLSILTFFDLNYFVYCISVFGFAFSGGFFQVPCLATIQKSKSGRKLGDLFAYLNLSTFIFVLIGTFLFWITTYLTNQNSYAVFGVIYVICIITFIIFNFRIKKHS